MVFQKSACIEPMYSELPFLERFRAAKDDGFDFVEFWSWTDKDLDAVKTAAEKAGIGIAGFNGDAELSLIDPEQKDDYLAFLRRSVEAAKKVGARSVTIHSNGLGVGGVVIDDFKLINGSNGVFLAAPSKPNPSGRGFRATVWLEDQGLRERLNELAVDAYRDAISQLRSRADAAEASLEQAEADRDPGPAPIREQMKQAEKQAQAHNAAQRPDKAQVKEGRDDR